MATTSFSNVANNAKTTLSGAINAVVTTCTVASGSSLPSVPFYATFFSSDPDVNEIVKVTAKSGATITTMVRGQQGTAANSWANGDNFQVLWTKTNVTELQSAINDIETRLGSGTTDVTITTGDVDVSRSGAVLNPTWTSYNGGAANLVNDYKISRGTSGTPVIVQANDAIDQSYWGHDGTAFREFARIRAYINGTPGASDMPGGLKFYVSADGTATPVLALTIAQDLSAAFAGAFSCASTFSCTGAATYLSTFQAYGNFTLGSTGASNRQMVINANAGFRADIYLGGVNSALRWGISKQANAESGSNAGSAFAINAYDDSGNFLDQPLYIVRALYGEFGIYRPATFYSKRTDTVKSITYASTITPNLRDGSYQKCTLTGNVTIAAPTNAAEGDIFEILITQDGTGSRTATWNGVFTFASGDSGTLTTTASKRDWFRFRAISASSFLCVAVKKNI